MSSDMSKYRTRNEIIGIELMRTDSEVGCELLIFNKKQFIFSLSIARKKMSN